jgi:hypothetical protein
MMTETSNRRAFLCGTNVEDIHDPLLFPDPPTPDRRKRTNATAASTTSTVILHKEQASLSRDDDPVAVSNSNRRKRRNSSPVMPLDESRSIAAAPIEKSTIVKGPTPPKDVTNIAFSDADTHSISKTKVATQQDRYGYDNIQGTKRLKMTTAAGTSAASRPPRRSMPVYRQASPLLSSWDVAEAHAESPRCTDARSEIEADRKPKGRKSDKRRRSFVLPSAVELSRGQSALYSVNEEELGAATRESQVANQMKNSENSAHNDKERYAQMRKAVRKFCKLHPSERMTSSRARRYGKTIEDLSGGYRLISNYQIEQQDRQQVQMRSKKDLARDLDKNQRAIYYAMPPMISSLEKERTKETNRVQQFTNCKVERRGSSYYYIDVSTGNTVHGDEYERRYLKAVELPSREEPDVKQRESIKVTDPSEPLEQQDLVQSSRTKVDGSHIKHRHPSAPSLIESSSNDAEETNASSPVRQKRSRSEGDDASDMDECSTPVSVPPSPEPPREIVASQTKSSSPSLSCPNLASMTSIPLRGEVSSHPEIAKAQEKLWSAMDHALNEYSSTVMQIHKGDQSQL